MCTKGTKNDISLPQNMFYQMVPNNLNSYIKDQQHSFVPKVQKRNVFSQQVKKELHNCTINYISISSHI